MKKILAIDDVRACDYANVVARTYKDGVDALCKMGPWDELHLDNDIGAVEQQYSLTGKPYEGYDVLVLIEAAFMNSQYPKVVNLLTSNSSARQKMQSALTKMNYKSIDGIRWERETSI